MAPRQIGKRLRKESRARGEIGVEALTYITEDDCSTAIQMSAVHSAKLQVLHGTRLGNREKNASQSHFSSDVDLNNSFMSNYFQYCYLQKYKRREIG